MKFNPREKILLSFLAVIAVGALYVNLFLMPQLNFINNTKQEIEQLQQTTSNNLLIKKRVSGLDSELKIFTQKFKDLRAVFPPNINHEELLIILRDLADECELDLDNVTFTEMAEVQVADDGKNDSGNSKQNNAVQDENSSALAVNITNLKMKDTLKSLGLDGSANQAGEKEEKKNVKIPDGKGYTLDVKMTIRGNNSQIKSLISKIEGLKSKSSIKDLSITKEDTGLLMTNITVEFYGIMDKNANEYTLLADGTWEPLEAGDRDNIFKTYEGYLGPKKVMGQKTSSNESDKTGQDGLMEALKELQKYDITMGILPYGEGMSSPTVTISGRHVAPEGNIPIVPVIYGDNKGEEKVSFIFEDKEGKTVCRIRTQNDSYPRKTDAPAGEVKTTGDSIMILVDSLPRKGSNDNAGANITITNKSKKQVVVDVRYEDKNKPRVKINKAAGDIVVNYN